MRAWRGRRPDHALAHEPTLGATAALAVVTASVAVGMGRLFTGVDHLAPLLGATLAGHGVMLAGRRLRAPIAVSAAAAMSGVALVGAWILLPDTTAYGVPGAATAEAARAALVAAWAEFGDVVAPAPATDGFLLASMAGIGVTAVLADWAAFRMRVLFEAVVPSFTLFVFTAMLGGDGGRAPMVALYVLALLAFLVVHRAGLESEGTPWFASRSRAGTGALLQGAAALGLVAVVGAVAVGPRLPGASADALLGWRNSDGPGGNARRTTVSPLVDIRARLVDQGTSELFSVQSSRKSYWRLTSLDTFDGRIWSSDARYSRIGRRVPGGAGGGAPASVVTQEFTIRSLSSIWLPAAYRPVGVLGVTGVSYNADLGSLITGENTTDGLTYRVQSAVPELTPGDLEGGEGELADPERFLRLPRLAPRVVALARSLTRSASTPYEQALAIQGFFRSGFEYSLDVDPGHDGRALEDFLFDTRIGYCEQFAGSYAVLARAVGLPARVAVGFTAGELGDDGAYHVRGLNAHAWPEVFLPGAGWVAFEPTPGRGAPGAESYTGVPESQAAPEDRTTATTAGPSTTVAPDDPSSPSTTTAPGAAPSVAAGGESGRPLWRHPLLVVPAALVALGLLAAACVPLVKARRRHRRRRLARSPAERIWVAWTEAAEALARAGAPRRPAETLTEHAARAGAAAVLPAEAAGALDTLARTAAAASYSDGPFADAAARQASADAGTVEAAVNGMATRRRRLTWLVDPRPLLAGGRPGARAASRRSGGERVPSRR